MTPTEDRTSGRLVVPDGGVRDSGRGPDDARVIQAMHEYLAALEAGDKPDRAEFLARHPDIAAELSECLEGLEFVHVVGPHLSHPQGGERAEVPSVSVELQAEVPLGDFRIVREVGRGGMGVVYEAEQLSLGRRVALKVLPFAAALDARQLQRFKNEAQAAAHLHHQHIVPVYAVGCERGVHYYAMQYIDGQTLAAVIAGLRQPASAAAGDGPPPPADGPVSGATTIPQAGLSTERLPRDREYFRGAARWGVQAAEALEHAHALGIVHRDIKPANLLVDALGYLWVTDFGLAHCQGDTRLTLTGDLLGTLRYMSPEQALARHGLLDHRTDIYSLGVTLYEVLTLEPAFSGSDRHELLQQIAFEEPRPPGQLNPAVPAELETIVLKAMAKAPEERYATAQELADDLERFLKDEPIRARRPTRLQRVRKWARRHRPVVWTAGASLVVSLAMAVAVLATSNVRIAHKQQQTDEALAAETQAKKELQEALEGERHARYLYGYQLARREWAANNLRRAEQLLDECPAELRAWEWHYLKGLCRVSPLTCLADRGTIRALAFNPDGRRLASAADDGIFSFVRGDGYKGTVKVWDTKAGKKLFILSGHTGIVHGVAYSPDGRRLASASADQTVKVWDAITGEEVLTFRGHKSLVYAVTFSPDGRRLASGSADRTIKILDAATGEEFLTLRVPAVGVSDLAFSPDGWRLTAVMGFDGTLKVWDVSPSGQGREEEAITKGASK